MIPSGVTDRRYPSSPSESRDVSSRNLIAGREMFPFSTAVGRASPGPEGKSCDRYVATHATSASRALKAMGVEGDRVNVPPPALTALGRGTIATATGSPTRREGGEGGVSAPLTGAGPEHADATAPAIASAPMVSDLPVRNVRFMISLNRPS